jgi:hypothetical protein
MNAIVAKPHTQIVTRPTGRRVVVPALVAAAGEPASRRFLEFFAATISNKNTRAAYYRATGQFFAWLEQHGIDELVGIEPLHVAAYIEQLQSAMAKPTVKQHLAAIRMLFDWLVVGQIPPPTRRTPCVARNTSSTAARHRCSPPTRRAG